MLDILTGGGRISSDVLVIADHFGTEAMFLSIKIGFILNSPATMIMCSTSRQRPYLSTRIDSGPNYRFSA